MNQEVIAVQVRAVLPLEGSFAVFLGNSDKTFVIYVDEGVGAAISMFMRGVAKERPLTHDLIAHILLAFGGKVERVIINHVEGSVFHARLILSAENELHIRKVVEIDARPSDSIALAVHQNAPIYVAAEVWSAVDDVSETLARIEAEGLKSTAEAIVPPGVEEMVSDEDGVEDEDVADEVEDEELAAFSDEIIDAIADQSGISPNNDTYDDGYGHLDDDDEEGEEWKKG
ncbi:MAG: bifunctional nuclease family protein [Verrucomicrobiaceae bacterium]|nr:bifunctional nuclease family protein [Verrucomicrobiaceae bacterium]